MGRARLRRAQPRRTSRTRHAPRPHRCREYFLDFLLAPPRASGLSDIWGSAFLPPFASRGKQGGDYCSSLSLTPCERPCWPRVVLQRRLAVARCQLEQPNLAQRARRLWINPICACQPQGDCIRRISAKSSRHTDPLLRPSPVETDIPRGPTTGRRSAIVVCNLLGSLCLIVPVRWPTKSLWDVPVLFCCGATATNP